MDRGSGVCGFFPRFEWFPDGVIAAFKRGDIGREGRVAHFMKGGL